MSALPFPPGPALFLGFCTRLLLLLLLLAPSIGGVRCVDAGGDAARGPDDFSEPHRLDPRVAAGGAKLAAGGAARLHMGE